MSKIIGTSLNCDLKLTYFFEFKSQQLYTILRQPQYICQIRMSYLLVLSLRCDMLRDFSSFFSLREKICLLILVNLIRDTVS